MVFYTIIAIDKPWEPLQYYVERETKGKAIYQSIQGLESGIRQIQPLDPYMFKTVSGSLVGINKSCSKIKSKLLEKKMSKGVSIAGAIEEMIKEEEFVELSTEISILQPILETVLRGITDKEAELTALLKGLSALQSKLSLEEEEIEIRLSDIGREPFKLPATEAQDRIEQAQKELAELCDDKV